MRRIPILAFSFLLSIPAFANTDSVVLKGTYSSVISISCKSPILMSHLNEFARKVDGRIVRSSIADNGEIILFSPFKNVRSWIQGSAGCIVTIASGG